MTTCTYFRFRDFILGPVVTVFLSTFSSETPMIYGFHHIGHANTNTKTTVGITAELQFPLINITSIAQIPLLTGSVIRDSQSRLQYSWIHVTWGSVASRARCSILIASGLHSGKERYVAIVVVAIVVVTYLLLRMILSEWKGAAARTRYGVVACFAVDLQAKYFSLYFWKYS